MPSLLNPWTLAVIGITESKQEPSHPLVFLAIRPPGAKNSRAAAFGCPASNARGWKVT